MRLLALGLTITALAYCGEQRFDVTTTETTALPAGGTVRIEGSTGELNVEGWDRPNVEIQVDRYAWGNNEQRTKAALGRVQVSKELSGSVLTLRETHKRFSDVKVDYRIRVPKGANLAIHHGVGDVTIYDVGGNIETAVKSGDVVVQLPGNGKYQFDARTRVGNIYSDFPGVRHPFVQLVPSSGETMKPAPEGAGDPKQIRLHTGIGGITIQKVSPQPLLSLN